MGSKISLLVYEWPLIKCKIWFSKLSQIWAKILSDLSQNWLIRKFWKNQVISLKIRPKIEPIGTWMGHFFLKNWYLYRSTFKFHGNLSLPKPNLCTPPGLQLFVYLVTIQIKYQILYWLYRIWYLYWLRYQDCVCMCVCSNQNWSIIEAGKIWTRKKRG